MTRTDARSSALRLARSLAATTLVAAMWFALGLPRSRTGHRQRRPRRHRRSLPERCTQSLRGIDCDRHQHTPARSASTQTCRAPSAPGRRSIVPATLGPEISVTTKRPARIRAISVAAAKAASSPDHHAVRLRKRRNRRHLPVRALGSTDNHRPRALLQLQRSERSLHRQSVLREQRTRGTAASASALSTSSSKACSPTTTSTR